MGSAVARTTTVPSVANKAASTFCSFLHRTKARTKARTRAFQELECEFAGRGRLLLQVQQRLLLPVPTGHRSEPSNNSGTHAGPYTLTDSDALTCHDNSRRWVASSAVSLEGLSTASLRALTKKLVSAVRPPNDCDTLLCFSRHIILKFI